jgi:transcriptional regulator GlxA family with amidase domain
MNFGILIFPGVEELDFVGPWEMISTWERMASGPRCKIIAQESRVIECAKGLWVTPHHSFENCPPLDYLLVPGGPGTGKEVTNNVLLDFIKKQAAGCQAILSVCTGAFILHAAGLLTGLHATTHRNSLNRLRAFGDVKVVEERYVRDGKIWTSAGVSAGMDLSLAFIEAISGSKIAEQVREWTEYYPSFVA